MRTPNGHRPQMQISPFEPKRRCRLTLCLAAALLVLAGCGLNPGTPASGPIRVRVTSDFGSRSLATGSVGQTATGSSVLDLTRRFVKVTAAGAQVRSLAGHSATHGLRWFLYVNGIAASESAALTNVHPGDRVWWDLHDAMAAKSVPAVVGAYPEPFTSGSGGQRYPTVLTCASGLTQACDRVTKALDGAGVKVSFQGLGTGSGSDSLAVLVGTFDQLQGVIASELLQGGAALSGVYGQFVGSHGQVLELDNGAGDVEDTFHGSVGFIAATEQTGLSEPVWLVTGTDRAGVAAAAGALTAAKLARRFAVAVLPSGKVIPVPTGRTS